MVKYPKVGYEFRNEPATIVLTKNQNPPPQPIIKVNGKKLGQLDKNAVALFKKHNRFSDKLTFSATLNSYGSVKTREVVATTLNGTSFKIEKSHFLEDKDLKEAQFNGEKVTLTLSLEVPKKTAMIANIQQSDGSLLPIAEFTTNQKASKEALAKAGLFQEGATFQAKITSRVTAARIEIEPKSIEYPELGQWQSANNTFQKVELEPTAKQFIDQITSQPTLLHHFDQDCQLDNGQTETLPTVGLSVDMNRVAATKQFLENHQIPYRLLDPEDHRISLETQRSYGVFWMKKSDLSTPMLTLMEQASNGSYQANFEKIASISPYHEKLESIAPLPPPQQQERIANSQSAFKQAITQTTQDSRTQIVAPIADAYLQVQDPSQGKTKHYQGQQITLDYDGDHLTITDSQTGEIKMKARRTGVATVTRKNQWQTEFPAPSPGLTQADVEKWTSEKTQNYIKKKMEELGRKKTVISPPRRR